MTPPRCLWRRSINLMAKAARRRETNHVKAIYRWHRSLPVRDFIKYW